MEWQTTTTILDGLRDYENRSAWDRLNERFRGAIVRFVRQGGVPEAEADDVAQETLLAFAEAYRRGQYDRQRGKLSSWLFGIAFNHAMRHRQKAGRDGARISSASTTFWGDVPDRKHAEDLWQEQWEETVWQLCLSRVESEVSPDVLRTFKMSISDHRSAAEVAEQIGVSVKSLYNAKHRVLKRLRALREEIEQVA